MMDHKVRSVKYSSGMQVRGLAGNLVIVITLLLVNTYILE